MISLSQKARLFVRLARLPAGLAVVAILLLAANWGGEVGVFEMSPEVRERNEVLIEVLSLGIAVALVFSFLKLRRGLLALNNGVRLQAKVKRARLHRNREDDEPLYVLDWVDEEGVSGSSLPGEWHEFAGFKEGVTITVYRNNRNDSWWERDIVDS